MNSTRIAPEKADRTRSLEARPGYLNDIKGGWWAILGLNQ